MDQSDYNNTLASFYADDGLLENKDPMALQKDLDTIINLFEYAGLNTNSSKTKAIIVNGRKPPTELSAEAYRKMIKKEKNVVYRSKRVICTHCGKELAQRSLQQHMEQIHRIKNEKYLC